jgi:hypothetical protein
MTGSRWTSSPLSVAGLVTFALVVVCYVLIMFRLDTTGSMYWSGGSLVKQSKGEPPLPKLLEDAINSATANGTLFTGGPIRTFVGERLFAGHANDDAVATSATGETGTRQFPPPPAPAVVCDRWNVVATVLVPSEAIRRACMVAGWCTVIIADTETPHDFMAQGGMVGMEGTVHFLSVSDQQAWLERESFGNLTSAVGRFLAAIPHNHLARKNIGYLYAIQHGAKLLFDFDEGSLLPVNSSTGQVFPPLSDDSLMTDARIVVTGPAAFNHHPLMGANISHSWARGFPLQHIKDRATRGQIAYDGVTLDLMESVGVVELYAAGRPDIDAIHRVGHPLPVAFVHPEDDAANGGSSLENSPVSARGPLVVPSHAFAPYNAQATIHTSKALWALLLPLTVPGRVSDIWRGYFAQALFRDLGLSVTFLPSALVPDQNESHNPADRESELDLDVKGGKLIEFLSGWDSPAESVPGRMEELWIALYERGFLDLKDVNVVQLWLAALVEIGYEFPPMLRRRVDHTVLMGQFNYALDTEGILFWHQKWRQWFNRIVLRGPFDDTQIHELQRHGIQALEGDDDNGFYSPMTNLAATLRDVKATDAVTGVLYVHDDMLLNITNMFQNFEFGTKHLLGTLNFQPNDPSFHSYSIHPNGTYSTQDGPTTKELLLSPTNRTPWFHALACLDAFSQVLADPRSKALSLLDTDGSLHVPRWGQCDVMYVPTTVADDFANLALLMVEHRVFLECGFPKIVDTLYRTSNVTFDLASLCTSWDGDVRGQLLMLEECQFPMSAHHPIKLSMGLSKWNQAFEWATMGKSKFNS